MCLPQKHLVLAAARLEAGLREPLVYFGYSSATEYCLCDSVAASLTSLTVVLLLIWGGGGGGKTLSSLPLGNQLYT